MIKLFQSKIDFFFIGSLIVIICLIGIYFVIDQNINISKAENLESTSSSLSNSVFFTDYTNWPKSIGYRNSDNFLPALYFLILGQGVKSYTNGLAVYNYNSWVDLNGDGFTYDTIDSMFWAIRSYDDTRYEVSALTDINSDNLLDVLYSGGSIQGNREHIIFEQEADGEFIIKYVDQRINTENGARFRGVNL